MSEPKLIGMDLSKLEMKGGFVNGDVCKILQIEWARFTAWEKLGFFEPSVQKAAGLGTPSLYSHADVYRIALFRHLIEELKMKRAAASRYLRRLSDQEVINRIDIPGFPKVEGGEIPALRNKPKKKRLYCCAHCNRQFWGMLEDEI
jgi:hypothetical protein